MAGSISPDGARAEITENAIVMGNPVKDATKTPITTPNPLSVNSLGQLDDAVPLPITASAITDAFTQLSGTPNGNIMTQSLVAGASATTATAAGWYRITVVSVNEAIMSSGAYYVPLVTLS